MGRAKRAAAVNTDEHEDFDPADIFDRDGWRCGLCGKPVRKDYQWPDPRARSLDHILPLSKGGAHTRANVQLAHLRCNWSKNDRVEAVQLRLVG